MSLATTDSHEAPPIWPAKHPLLRPKKGRWFAGVCQGISLHIGVSVVWIRLITIALAFVYGAGIVGYVLLWIFIPAGDPLAQHVDVHQAPLSHGLTDTSSTQENDTENLEQMLVHAPKPALFALAGIILIALAIIINISANGNTFILPAVFALLGVSIAWLKFNAQQGQMKTMIIGMCLIFTAFAIVIIQAAITVGSVPLGVALTSGLGLLFCVIMALVPWIVSLIHNLSTERALKEREEERADMTAHLHDGVLQTLALIQMHVDEPQTVFTLARSQERELRNWLYQERTTPELSVSAGLQRVAGEIEDVHGVAIDVVSVGDAQPSTQTDALLDATRQALVNAVTHGSEPISVYCEANDQQVDVFVRDHGEGFDVERIPSGRLGIKESIIGRIERRGGSVHIVSRPQWGTEVRMHMPLAAMSGGNEGSGMHVRGKQNQGVNSE